MAFSFRVGTNWYHDFPKLARESGFHFNMHKTKVRVDWNRISNIDIERVIHESDFWIVDENVNNVIDYSLESEYDVKILDPNFVKLFRLAQLAVEYLLYCKQYLDHSVVLLKDELKSKIEESNKLKKEIVNLEDTIAQLKEKVRERNRLIELRATDSSGEIHKCPHCPKTFVSSIFVTAHIARRHHYLATLESSVSPVHDGYRAETEKLNNEIKALKERLNQTEKVIRNESKISDRAREHVERKSSIQDTESSKSDFEKIDDFAKFKSYHEDISNLKSMLFDEIKNLRQRSMYDHVPEISVQTLMNQQEKEFQKLRNQILDKLTPDIDSMQSKLHAQEDYWKSKLEHLESEHRKDIEKLLGEFKLTQESSDRIKSDYESKIKELEQQTLKQSGILSEQSKQLKQLSDDLRHSQNEFLSNQEIIIKSNQIDRSVENLRQSQEHNLQRTSDLIRKVTTDDRDSISSDSEKKAVPPVITKNHITKSASPSRNISSDSAIHYKKVKQVKPAKSSNRELNFEDKERSQITIDRSIPKNCIRFNEIQHVRVNRTDKIGMQPSLMNHNEVNDADSSDIKSESLTISSESAFDSESESMITIKDDPYNSKKTNAIDSTESKLVRKLPTDRNVVQAEIRETVRQKLRDLGIDPEWQAIPHATFKQKMDIVKHHGKITAKRLPKYNEIKLKISNEIHDKLTKKNRRKFDRKSLKRRSIGDFITSVKDNAVKAFASQRDIQVPKEKLEKAAMTRTVQGLKETQQISETSEKSNINRGSNRVTYVACRKNSYSYDSAESTPKTARSIASSIDEHQSKLILDQDEKINGSVDIYQSFVNQVEHSLQIPASDRIQHRLTSTPVTKQSVLVKPAEHSERSTLRSHEDIVQSFLNSPKNSKSVLKSTSASTSSLIKKKVNFDLKNDETEEFSSISVKEQKRNASDQFLQYRDDKLELESQWKSTSTPNIILKTSQSSKIAEISRKIEEQLSMARHQPVGSIEAIFSPKQSEEKMNTDSHEEQLKISSIESLPQSPLPSSRSYRNSLPQPAPRHLPEKALEIVNYDTDDFDLNSDIDEILKTE